LGNFFQNSSGHPGLDVAKSFFASNFFFERSMKAFPGSLRSAKFFIESSKISVANKNCYNMLRADEALAQGDHD
jgi:hypothetical protein